MNNTVDKIQDRLNELWAGYIEEFNYDMFSHTITLELYMYDEVISQATIVFQDVYSHLFHDPDSSKDKKTPYLSERIELTSIEYVPNAMDFKTISKYAPNATNLNLKGDFNIFIELWNASLYLKANKLKINDEVFELA